MRPTILAQFLYPVLAIVLVAVAAASLSTAWWYAMVWEHRDQQHVAKIVDTLTAPGFPLTESVLVKMSALSGVDFALVERNFDVAAATLTIDDAGREQIVDWIRHAARQDDASSQSLELGGRSYGAQWVPVRSADPAAEPPLLIVLSPQTGRWASLRRALPPPLVIGAAACLVLIATITWQSRKVVRPLRRLQRQTEAIAEGDFRPLEPPATGDEVHQLAVAINVMVSRLQEYEQRIRQHERLQTLGQLAGSMAHHLRNAATGGRLALELHARDCPLGEHQEDLEVARRQLSVMETHLQRLLLMARAESAPQPAVREEFELVEVVKRVVALIESSCRHAQIKLEVSDFDPEIRLSGDPDAVEQVVTNLAFNAIEAVQQTDSASRRDAATMATSSAAAARVAIEIQAGGDRVQIVVRDTGPGPSAEIATRMFDPFATNKSTGAGLGLAVANEVAASHGGSIRWARVDGMTCFVLDLPLAVGSARMLESPPCSPQVGR